MAATEVIRFRFGRQAVRNVRFSTLNPSFLFEHSPPSPWLAHSLSPFDSSSHVARIRVFRHLLTAALRSDRGKKGRFECKRPICTMQFCW
jgi:hypothetical protein